MFGAVFELHPGDLASPFCVGAVAVFTTGNAGAVGARAIHPEYFTDVEVKGIEVGSAGSVGSSLPPFHCLILRYYARLREFWPVLAYAALLR